MFEEDCDKIAFMFHHGLSHFVHMVFKLKNVPETFQQAMDVVLTKGKTQCTLPIQKILFYVHIHEASISNLFHKYWHYYTRLQRHWTWKNANFHTLQWTLLMWHWTWNNANIYILHCYTFHWLYRSGHLPWAPGGSDQNNSRHRQSWIPKCIDKTTIIIKTATTFAALFLFLPTWPARWIRSYKKARPRTLTDTDDEISALETLMAKFEEPSVLVVLRLLVDCSLGIDTWNNQINYILLQMQTEGTIGPIG